jgi:membrane protein implicated in regulation of membrane protease activity
LTVLLSIYIAAAIFGVGVTVVDVVGLLGSHAGDTGGGHEGAGGDHGGEAGADHGADAMGDHWGGDHDIAGHGGVTMADHGAEAMADHGAEAMADHGAEAVADHGAGAGHEAADHAAGGEHGHAPADRGERASVVGHERESRRSLTLSLLSLLRSVVYFCLGFGPVGVFALLTGGTLAFSLLWSVPVGVVVMVGTRLVRRLMRRNLDSQLRTEDFLLEKGVVTVSIGKGQMGKVRVLVGGIYAERFARAQDPQESIPVGTRVRVVDATDECVYVEVE